MRIGIFDSGYGGLTIWNAIRQRLPEYDYLYFGDNARAPYGTRSFDCIYQYTLEAVKYLSQQHCSLIILACNTASAKALRTIQQHDLPIINAQIESSIYNETDSSTEGPLTHSGADCATEGKRNLLNVLGVIRPTVEVVPTLTTTKHVAILATPGTVASGSYVIELLKQDPLLTITQQACPMWVPLIEAGEHHTPGANYFIERYVREVITADPLIDTLILGCTHYPLIKEQIEKVLNKLPLPPQVCQRRVIAQGEIVAESLADYLHRHPEREQVLLHSATTQFVTTDDPVLFSNFASRILNIPIKATKA